MGCEASTLRVKDTRSRVFVLTILFPKTPTLTGCRVERGLLECKSDEGVAGMVPCG